MDQPDVFSENIRQKLEGHEIPVDAACWGEIEVRMNANKKKKVIPFWWWLSGGAAVATLALLLTIGSLNNSDKHIISRTIDKSIQNKEIKSNGNSEKRISIFKPTIEDKSEKASRTAKQTEKVIEEYLSDIHNIKQDSTLPNNQVDSIKNSITTNVQIAETADSVTNATKKKYNLNSHIAETKEEPTIKTKIKEGWLLAASINQGGTTSVGSTNDFLYATNAGDYLSGAKPNYTTIMSAKDFSKIKFYSALSVGLVVRKNLTDVYSIETGLMYSYLFSSFEESGTFVSYDATLSLHYLGIPVNLVAQLWENPKWEFYVSGGGMAEKGLRSIYTQNQHTGNQTITTTAETGITGFQWSLNGAVGVTYKLHRNIGIYLEPKVSYFFQNNQPVSARTEQPAIVGLTAGLRFQFK